MTFNDIHNRSDSKIVSGGINGQLNLSNIGQGEPQMEAEKQERAKQAEHDRKMEKINGTPLSNSVSPNLPFADSRHDNSVTKATLTEGKITLNKDSKPTETTVEALGINSDLSQANRQVEAPKDINKLLKEQQSISQSVGEINKAANVFSSNQAKKLDDEASLAEKAGDFQTAEAKRQEAQSWQIGGSNKRKVDAITNAISLTLAGQSPQAIAAGTASPYVNQAIKEATKEIPELNIPAHILWGAIEAELAGGKASTGAIAAGVGELAAPVISQALFGDKALNELTANEKEQVLNLSKLAAGVATGLVATGNSAENLVAISQGMKVAENAVENNALSLRDVYAYQRDLKKAIQNNESIEDIHEHFKALSEKQRAELLASCDIDCRLTVPKELNGATEFADDLSGFISSWLRGLPLDEQTKFYQLVESENAKTIQALKEKQSGLEKGIELALDAAHLFSKESDIGGSSTRTSLYDSQRVRQKLEKEFGKENVTSTTVPPNNIKNIKLANKRHPKTGIPFDSKGYPIFDDISKYDTRLDIKSFRNSSYTEQMSMATKKLYKELGDRGLEKKFSTEQINAIKNGRSKIPGFTWHHHQDTGRMQLVPEWEHSKTGHVGGDYIQRGK